MSDLELREGAITIARTDGKRQVWALLVGPLAVHEEQTAHPMLANITHIASGWSITKSWTWPLAVELAKQLAALDWSGPAEELRARSELKSAVGAACFAARVRMAEEMGIPVSDLYERVN